MVYNLKQINPNKRFYLIVLLSLLFLLFFWGGPNYNSARSLRYFWNLGHIFFFAALPIIFVPYLSKRHSDKIVFLYVMVGTLILGMVIELIQTDLKGRISDLGDIFKNLIGALSYWVFLSPNRKSMKRIRLLLFQYFIIVLFILQLAPVVKALWDENLARRQFPLLSDFESSLEVERWTGDAVYGVTSEIKKRGYYSLKVMLTTSKYSGVSLKYFPRNWQEYKYFQFEVFNPKDTILKLTCRIHDWIHAQGDQNFSDRFNQSFQIKKGWQMIRIPLDKVKFAPKDRDMDMLKIQGVGIFSTALDTPRVIYIDDVKLMR